MSLFGRLFGGGNRTVDLDNAIDNGELPAGIRVVSEDDFGPLIIEVDHATVYPSGAIEQNGALLLSERFHLTDERGQFTDTIHHNGKLAAVISKATTRGALLTLTGPRLATLGGLAPDIPVLVRVDDVPLSYLATRCGVRIGAITYSGGAAHSADTVLLARIPVWTTSAGVQVDIAQRNAFVAMMSEGEDLHPLVYLEDVDPSTGAARAHTNTGAMRATAVREGFRLISPVRRPLPEVISAIRGADVVIAESPDVVAFTQFATPGTKIVVFTPNGEPPTDLATEVATTASTIRLFEADNAGVIYLDVMESAIAWACGDTIASPYLADWNLPGFRAESPQSVYLDRQVDITKAGVLPYGVERTAPADLTWRAGDESSRVFRFLEASFNAAGSILLADGTGIVGESIGVPPISEKDGPLHIGTFAIPIAFAPGSLVSLDAWRETVAPRLLILQSDLPNTQLAIAQTPFDVDDELVEMGVAPSIVLRIPAGEIDGFAAVSELYIAAPPAVQS